MFEGSKGPTHVFPNCPHVKRAMGITGVASVYRLSANSQVLNLIRCKWCRSLYLTLMTEDPEMPPEVVAALALVPKEGAA